MDREYRPVYGGLRAPDEDRIGVMQVIEAQSARFWSLTITSITSKRADGRGEPGHGMHRCLCWRCRCEAGVQGSRRRGERPDARKETRPESRTGRPDGTLGPGPIWGSSIG